MRIFFRDSADWLPSTGGVRRRLAKDLLAFEELSAVRTRTGNSGVAAFTVRLTSFSFDSTLRKFNFGLATGGNVIGGAVGGVDRGGVKIGGVTLLPTGGLAITGVARVNGIADDGRRVASDGDGVLDSTSVGIASGAVDGGEMLGGDGTPLPIRELFGVTGAELESAGSGGVLWLGTDSMTTGAPITPS